MNFKMKNSSVLTFIFTVLGIFFSSQTAVAQVCDVTWRKADNPRTISGTVTIPAGQTVCVEAGGRVQFASDGQLILNGRIVGAGAAADRIVFAAANVFPNRIRNGGTLDLSFADVGVPIAMNGGTLACQPETVRLCEWNSITARSLSARTRPRRIRLFGAMFRRDATRFLPALLPTTARKLLRTPSKLMLKANEDNLRDLSGV